MFRSPSIPTTLLCAWRTVGILEMPDEHFKLCLKSALLQSAHSDLGGGKSSSFPSLPNADFGALPLAEFRSFPAGVAFAFRDRFPGAPLRLAWRGEVPGAVGEDRGRDQGRRARRVRSHPMGLNPSSTVPQLPDPAPPPPVPAALPLALEVPQQTLLTLGTPQQLQAPP